MKSLSWFTDRIDTKVYVDTGACDCNVCTSISKSGLLIHDQLHAEYLFNTQEQGSKYYESKKELNGQ